ncbi:unnamed protein product [Prorocentrum cordatum]|uniref:Uncharacterized protein n=1 Tax=Prorocentrum cordatum TaxID=2364126 RepID=A0ABN9TNU2_9DINO|nr:unnamed protein product [Polarella glacialis]
MTTQVTLSPNASEEDDEEAAASGGALALPASGTSRSSAGLPRECWRRIFLSSLRQSCGASEAGLVHHASAPSSGMDSIDFVPATGYVAGCPSPAPPQRRRTTQRCSPLPTRGTTAGACSKRPAQRSYLPSRAAESAAPGPPGPRPWAHRPRKP